MFIIFIMFQIIPIIMFTGYNSFTKMTFKHLGYQLDQQKKGSIHSANIHSRLPHLTDIFLLVFYDRYHTSFGFPGLIVVYGLFWSMFTSPFKISPVFLSTFNIPASTALYLIVLLSLPSYGNTT